MDRETLMTVDQVADFLQVCKETVRRYTRTGDLKCTKLGRQLRFSRAQLEEFIVAFSEKDLGEVPPDTENEDDEVEVEDEDENDEDSAEPVAELDDHDII